ncbi:MAG TPA: LssY C-terminal domain-containing protein [Paludibaculum sp.]|jgi:hypothetical protein
MKRIVAILFQLVLALALSLPAATLPTGAALEVRLRQTISSYSSQSGTELRAELIAPVLDNGRTLLPQGSVLRGRLADVKSIRMGLRNLRASLRVDFDELQLPDGSTHPVQTRLVSVDSAREAVDASGKIVGIRATSPFGFRLAGIARNLFIWDPLLQLVIAGSTAAVLRFPEAEIYYPAGTEMLVSLAAPLTLDTTSSTPLPRIASSMDENERLRDLVRKMTYRTYTAKHPRPADYVNLVFIGDLEWIERAFAAAGWLKADRLSKATGWMSFRSLAEARPYPTAPMSSMTLDESPARFQFSKALNSYSKRHHLRIFDQSEQWNGRAIGAASSTQDVGVTWAFRNSRLIHVIDRNIDNERAKIINDLVYTGCVDAAQLVPRPWVPQQAKVATGEMIETDGAVAVIELNPCRTPLRTLASDAPLPVSGGKAERAGRKFVLILGNDLTFNNPIYQAGKGAQFLWRRATGRDQHAAPARTAVLERATELDSTDPPRNGLP